MTQNRLHTADKLREYGITVQSGFMIRETEFGPTVLLEDGREAETAEFLRSDGFERLEINHALGFSGHDLGFLKEFAFLTGFEIIHRKIDDISLIHCLEKLNNISIQTFCRTPIEFSRFAELKHCRLHWRPKGRSIFECRQIESLFLDYYKSKDCKPVGKLTGIRKLTITNSPLEEIDPLADLVNLVKLDLSNLRKLTVITPVQHLSGLEFLRIDGARKLRDVNPLAALRNLKVLYLCDVGAIPSLAPLKDLSRLEALYAWGDTNILDGDLRGLLALPNLKKLAMMNRQHYSPTIDEVEAHLQRSV